MKKELKDKMIKEIKGLDSGLILIVNTDTGVNSFASHYINSAEIIGILFLNAIDEIALARAKKKIK